MAGTTAVAALPVSAGHLAIATAGRVNKDVPRRGERSESLMRLAMMPR